MVLGDSGPNTKKQQASTICGAIVTSHLSDPRNRFAVPVEQLAVPRLVSLLVHTESQPDSSLTSFLRRGPRASAKKWATGGG